MTLQKQAKRLQEDFAKASEKLYYFELQLH